MKEYYVKSMLSGLVTIVIATSSLQAIKKGQRFFSEPNRNKVPVRLLN
tara:strand:- start:1396 stop:1539 length:144 start_codon:yes stop_codon:yes gene_type:complete